MDDPNLLLQRAWDALREGVEPGKSAFSMISVATIGRDGHPKLRTVVIRRFDEAAGTIGFNTDVRAPKAAEIYANKAIAVLGYDSAAGIQVRMEGEATLHHAGPAHADAWVASADRSRICYRHNYAPGTALEDPALGDPTTAMVAPPDRELGMENFSAVSVRLTKVDYLDLKAGGHRRAVFERDDAGWIGGWVAP
ncbi:MAG: pyridoxamine 5'-phosphate oxidase family protein [Pseudomonadota bacterium]